MTFIVTLIATIIITLIVVFIFIKKKFADIAKDTAGGQTTATANTETAGLHSLTSNKGDDELHKVGMDTNPAHKTCK